MSFGAISDGLIWRRVWAPAEGGGGGNLNEAKSLTSRCEPDVAAAETPKMDLAARRHEPDAHVYNQSRGGGTRRPFVPSGEIRGAFHHVGRINASKYVASIQTSVCSRVVFFKIICFVGLFF